MAIYQPIRDAFNDFNKMILDSQQWDERHAAINHQREMDHLKLQSGLEQQAFNNMMSRESLKLQQAGETRAAQKLEFDIMHSNRNFDLTQEATKSNIASQKLSREKVALELGEMKQQIAGRENLLSEVETRVFTDPVEKHTVDLGSITTELEGINSSLKELNPDDTRTAAQRAHLKAARNNLMGAKNRTEAALKAFTPEVLTRDLQQRANAARQLAVIRTAQGDKATGDQLMATADDLDAQALSMDPEGKKGKGGKISGMMTQDQAYDNIAKAYTIEGMQGEMLNPRAKVKIRTVQSLHSRLEKKLIADGVGPERAREIALTQSKEITDILESQYFTEVEDIKAYSSRDLMTIIKKGYPNYKGKRSAAAIRDFLLKQELNQFQLSMREAGGSKNMPVYTPDRMMEQITNIKAN